jgi:hypothetical protein
MTRRQEQLSDLRWFKISPLVRLLCDRIMAGTDDDDDHALLARLERVSMKIEARLPEDHRSLPDLPEDGAERILGDHDARQEGVMMRELETD